MRLRKQRVPNPVLPPVDVPLVATAPSWRALASIVRRRWPKFRYWRNLQAVLEILMADRDETGRIVMTDDELFYTAAPRNRSRT
jgi:hypothetical protein